MIRMRLFGYEEFALAKRAAAGVMASCLRFLRRSAARPAVLGSEAKVRNLEHSLLPAWNSELRLPPPQLWDLLVRKARTWNIGEVEFSSVRNHRPRRIRWINAAAPVSDNSRWSLAVSLPGRDDAICELRAAGAEPITDKNDLAALESLLKTLGTHFAAHAEQLLGIPTAPQEPAEAHPSRRRQAA